MIAITPPKIFSKEVVQKQATPLPRQDLLTVRNRFRPNFRGWRLNQSSNFARPPPRGASPHAALTRAPPICLGRAGDACVLGVVERAGNALYVRRTWPPSCARSIFTFPSTQRPARAGAPRTRVSRTVGIVTVSVSEPHNINGLACGCSAAPTALSVTVRDTEMAPDRFKDFWRG